MSSPEVKPIRGTSSKKAPKEKRMQHYTNKELLLMMLSGRSKEVLKYLKKLPAPEMNIVRKRLIEDVEALQKRQTKRPTTTPSDKTMSKDLSSSTLSDTSSSSGTDKDSVGSAMAKNAGYLSAPAKATPMSQSMQALSLLSPSERANVELVGKYRIGEILGKGGFGTVLKAVSVETGGFVAIKQIDKEAVDDSQLPGVMKEAELLKRLNHPNILKILGVVETRTSLYFILELIESGSLAALVKKFGVFPEPLVALYIQQALAGLRYLHDSNIVHRDIKGDNILITKDGKVKLADFGTAKLEDADKKSQTVVGTPYWMAPEVIEMAPAEPASDIWSLGCTVIELLTGSPPYFDMGPMTALFNIVEDKHPPMPDNLSPELLDFLLKCFQRDPTLRPSAKELQEHSFIKKHVKQVEVPLDLDTVTGTIRQHNQSSKKKAAVFDVFGSNGLPPPTDTRDRSGSVTFAEPAVVSSGSNPQSRSLERERSGGALDHKERERAGSGPVGKKAKAPTKRRNPSRVEETTPNLNGTSRMSTMRQIEAANKDRTRFGLQADDLQHQLDNAVKERSAAAQRKAMMEKKLDRVLKDRRRILKQADGVSYFLREIGIRVSNLRDAEIVVTNFSKAMGKDAIKRFTKAASRSLKQKARPPLRRSRSLDQIL